MIQYIKRAASVVVLIMCSVITVQRVEAQSDTFSQYRDFLSLCTGYQQAPLQVNIRYQAGNNLVLNSFDTMSMQGYFYIGTAGAYYLRMGDVEQYIDDSIALMINHTLQQVVVNSSADNARRLLARYLGSVTNDTSVQTLINAYSIQAQNNASGNAYVLTSRSRLPSTQLSRQTIHMKYNVAKREPLEITTSRSTLVAIEPADSAAFAQKFAGQNLLVTLPNGGLYFVRKQTAVYTYQEILHQEPASLPMRVADYIMRNANGEYELVPAKSTYRLVFE